MTSSIAERVEEVEERIRRACAKVGRPRDDVTLIAASKSRTPDEVRRAWEAGIEVFGENRVQEALAKAAALPPEIEWQLIGPLQSNKVKPALELFRTVHSVDRSKIARRLDREAERRNIRLRVFIEVNVGEEESKHGFLPDELWDRIAPIAELSRLRVVGLMSIPPWEEHPEGARRWFRRLRELRDRMLERPEWARCPGYLSMGMSHDFEVGVEEGATHVRVGTAIFGPRG